jgi:hypothetical protein
MSVALGRTSGVAIFQEQVDYKLKGPLFVRDMAAVFLDITVYSTCNFTHVTVRQILGLRIQVRPQTSTAVLANHNRGYHTYW